MGKGLTEMKRSFVSFYERLAGLIGDVLADGKQQGLFNNVQESLVANAIIALVEGVGLQAFIRGRSAVNFVETYDFMVANFMMLLKKTPEGKKVPARRRHAPRLS